MYNNVVRVSYSAMCKACYLYLCSMRCMIFCTCMYNRGWLILVWLKSDRNQLYVGVNKLYPTTKYVRVFLQDRTFFFTRVVNQFRFRMRDSAPMAYLEFVDRYVVKLKYCLTSRKVMYNAFMNLCNQIRGVNMYIVCVIIYMYINVYNDMFDSIYNTIWV